MGKKKKKKKRTRSDSNSCHLCMSRIMDTPTVASCIEENPESLICKQCEEQLQILEKERDLDFWRNFEGDWEEKADAFYAKNRDKSQEDDEDEFGPPF